MKTDAFFLFIGLTFFLSTSAYADSILKKPSPANQRLMLLRQVQEMGNEISLEHLRSLFQMLVLGSSDQTLEQTLREVIAVKTASNNRAMELWRKPLVEGTNLEKREILRILAEKPYFTPELAELIRPLLIHRDPYLRGHAAEYAGLIPTPQTFRTELMQLAQSKEAKGPADDARKAAVESLAKAIANDTAPQLDLYVALTKDPAVQEESLDGLLWLAENGKLHERGDSVLKAIEPLASNKILAPRVFQIARYVGTTQLTTALRFLRRTIESPAMNEVAKAYAGRTAGDLLPLATLDYPERQILIVHLLEALKNPSPLIAAQAARGLSAAFENAKQQEREAIASAILKVTDHPSEVVRIQVSIALSRLGKSPGDKAVAVVFNAIGPTSNSAAIEGILSLNPAHVSAENIALLGRKLGAYIGDETVAEKFQSARAHELKTVLERYSGHPGREEFILALLKSENSHVQLTVVTFLQPELANMARLDILKYCVTPIIPYEKKSPAMQRLYELAASAPSERAKTGYLEAIKQALTQDEASAAYSAQLLLSIVSDPATQRKLLVDILSDQRSAVRAPAIELCNQYDQLPGDIITRLLRITLNATADAAQTEALLRRGSHDELNAAITEMIEQGNATQKRNLLRVSAKLAQSMYLTTPEAIEHAKNMLDDKDETVRRDAYNFTLALVSAPEKPALVVAAIRDPSAMVRTVGFDALPSIPDQAVSGLRTVLADAKVTVHQKAEILSEIQQWRSYAGHLTNEIQSLEKNPESREIASQALEHIRRSSQ